MLGAEVFALSYARPFLAALVAAGFLVAAGTVCGCSSARSATPRPIPMLDGGHLLFYGIEAVRRRPLPPAVQDMAFRVGFAVLLTLIVFANYNDIVRTAKGLVAAGG